MMRQQHWVNYCWKSFFVKFSHTPRTYFMLSRYFKWKTSKYRCHEIADIINFPTTAAFLLLLIYRVFVECMQCMIFILSIHSFVEANKKITADMRRNMHAHKRKIILLYISMWNRMKKIVCKLFPFIDCQWFKRCEEFLRIRF